jgi:hypothetical protein
MLVRLERAVERLVEGGIAGAFRLRVQPAEIGRQLERAMRDGRRSSVGGPLAPNLYLVRLHPEDAAAFAGWETALGHELERWLAELAFAEGLATVGPLQVRVAADGAVRRRAVRVEARFSENAVPSLRRSAPAAIALRLLPTDGRFPTAALIDAAVSVGRSRENDLVLDHPEVSRRHARIELADSRWVIFDLGSTNGTWQNGAAVAEAVLAPGDQIAFGGVHYTVVAE